MKRARATATGHKPSPLERGDRVLLTDGSSGALVLTADAAGDALVRRDDVVMSDKVVVAPTERYAVVRADSLVRG